VRDPHQEALSESAYRHEGIETVTDDAQMAIGPANWVEMPSAREVEGIREAVAGEARADGAPAVATRLAMLLVLIAPRKVLRSADRAAWRSGLTVVITVAVLRTALFAAYEVSSNSSTGDVAVGAAASLLSPLVFIGVATLALLLISAVARAGRGLTGALSLASLAAAPIVLKALLQSGTMAVTRHALHPTGIVGLVAPGASPLLLSLLAPIDLFGLWACALFVGAAVRSGRRITEPEDPEVQDAEAPAHDPEESCD
jgi:hypothetical protein